MKWQELLLQAANEPVFGTGFLLAGEVDSAGLRRQFSRWVNS